FLVAILRHGRYRDVVDAGEIAVRARAPDRAHHGPRLRAVAARDEILVALGLRKALSRPRADHAGTAVVLRDERGELERIEIDAAHVRVRKLGAAGLDVLGDEERALRAAARRVELCARLRR